jgi:8-oxo-dGTP diphosphatase
VITVTYFANLEEPDATGIRQGRGRGWFPVDSLPRWRSTKKIMNYAISRLRAKASYSNIVYGLMPEKFRLSDPENVQIIINKPLDKRNFRKRMLATGLLQETGSKDIAGAHRPAMLFKFKKLKLTVLD